MLFLAPALLLLLSALTASAKVWDHVTYGNGNGSFLRELLNRNYKLSAEKNATE